MKILSIQVGKPQTITHNGRAITTSILKAPVSGPVRLGFLNIEGDQQSDLTVHGGADKALYAYPHDTYSWWKKVRPQDLFEFGALGENLCMSSLPEDQIFVGDILKLGGSTVQVTQPRFPCFKLSAKFQDSGILKHFMELNRPGIYFRVLEEGMIQSGDELLMLEQEKNKISVQELFELGQKPLPKDRLEEILKIKSLNAAWRAKIEAKLK